MAYALSCDTEGWWCPTKAPQSPETVEEGKLNMQWSALQNIHGKWKQKRN